MKGREELLDAFLNRVCASVRAREWHADIRQELTAHIEELAAAKRDGGMTEEEALQDAIRCMGDPEEIGRGLHTAHRPKLHWGMLLAVAGLVAAGILAMWNVRGVMAVRMPTIAERSMVFMGVGLVMMLGLWFADYRILQRFGHAIHAGSIALLAMLPVIGEQMNGRRIYIELGPVGIDGTTVALFGLLIALASMQPMREWRGWRGGLQLVYRLILPLLLFLPGPSMVNALFFGLAFLVQAWLTRRNNAQFWKVVGLTAAGAIVLIGQTSIASPYYLFRLKERLTGFLIIDDPMGADYAMTRSLEAIRSAGWFGHGFGAWTNTLPYVHADSWFPYFVYCFGWAGGLAFAGLIAVFVGMLVRATAALQETFGRRLAVSLTVWLAVQCIWPLLMAFGWVPYAGIQLPIVSYGGLHTVLQLSAIGLLLGAYRRKAMVGPPAAAG